jgi:hypothetical protein
MIAQYYYHTNEENPGNGARDPAALFITTCPEFKPPIVAKMCLQICIVLYDI